MNKKGSGIRGRGSGPAPGFEDEDEDKDDRQKEWWVAIVSERLTAKG